MVYVQNHVFPKSFSSDPVTKMSDNNNSLATLFLKLSITASNDLKCVRLDRNVSTFCFKCFKNLKKSLEIAARVFSGFRLVKQRSHTNNLSVNLVSDQTLRMREYIRVYHQKLNRYSQTGESDFINYINGDPCIIKSRSKNSSSVQDRYTCQFQT